jgi:4-alpha-glucanotransferase
VSIGAPPDHLSPEGQNWNLAAFAPRKLRAQNYAPFRQILRSTMRNAGILRIDHVLGLNRSFWIPDDGNPGGYVRQPFAALIALIKIEAERAGTVVVGEDLGLVPDGFRAAMRRDGFLGYSVLQYEKDEHANFRDPSECDRQVLACFGTHDTPTLRGFAEGRDIDWWSRLGWIDDDKVLTTRAQRQNDVGVLAKLAVSDAGAPDRLAGSVYSALARSPAALVSVQLDDVLGQVEAQNLPGTVDQHPNWRRKYDLPIHAIEGGTALQTYSGWMRDRRSTTKPTDMKEVQHDVHDD